MINWIKSILGISSYFFVSFTYKEGSGNLTFMCDFYPNDDMTKEQAASMTGGEKEDVVIMNIIEMSKSQFKHFRFK